MASPTPNRGMTYPAHGGAVNAWDTPLNADFDNMDQAFNTYPIIITSTATTTNFFSSAAVISATVATITLPTSNALNFHYPITSSVGGLTQNVTLTFPAVGGFYDVFNNSSNAFSITAIVAGGTGPTIGQGGRSFLVADGVNMNLADTNVIARFNTSSGPPFGNVSGNAPAVTGSVTDAAWDFTNKQLNAAVTTGTSATAVWEVVGPILGTPGAYLTPTSNTPVLTADAIGSSAVFMVPFRHPWMVASNGTVPYPIQINNQLTVQLPSTAVATGNIYDVFFTANSTLGTSVPVLGVGPSWTVGGGSVTAGSGARGTGGGSTQLTKQNGYWVNTNSIVLGNGSSLTFTVSSGQAVWYGSVYCSSANGTVTVHRTVGQSRVQGISNAFNRQPVIIKVTDPSSSWTTSASTNAALTTGRYLNGSSANSCIVLQGQAEEVFDISYYMLTTRSGGGLAGGPSIGVGINSSNTFSGTQGFTVAADYGGNPGFTSASGTGAGRFLTAPSLGINFGNVLEGGQVSGTAYGTEQRTLLQVNYLA